MFEFDALDSDKCLALALSKNQLIFLNKILQHFILFNYQKLVFRKLHNEKHHFLLLVPSFYRFATSIWISVLQVKKFCYRLSGRGPSQGSLCWGWAPVEYGASLQRKKHMKTPENLTQIPTRDIFERYIFQTIMLDVNLFGCTECTARFFKSNL